MGNALNALLNAWSAPKFQPGVRNLLPGDEAAMAGVKSVECNLWEEYCAQWRFEPHAFHTRLMPMPWVGNLKTAKVFLLTLNPGLGAHDYFGEHRVPEYREMLMANLRQDDGHLFPFLRPEHSWHGGSAYWRPRLTPIVDRLHGSWLHCARRIAILELVPYHSEVFQLSDGRVNFLESVKLMRAFVRDELLPRSLRGECAIITMRGHERWKIAGLPKPSALGNTRSARLGSDDIQRAIELLGY
jgi:hypothetical protein